jgi:inositol-pentakisphosphate 2-kinase
LSSLGPYFALLFVDDLAACSFRLRLATLNSSTKQYGNIVTSSWTILLLPYYLLLNFYRSKKYHACTAMAGSKSSSFINESHPNDWEYLSEGGKHAVFAYKSRAASTSCLFGKVLRVDKAAFCSANFVSVDLLDRKNMIQIMFQAYLDFPQRVHIDESFLVGLKQQAIASNRIPASRKVDWGEDESYCSPVVAELMPNYQHSLSIEIKPKAGYLPTSPLVHPNNECKYTTSRFQILQQLNHRGVISKGWNKGSKVMGVESAFDPIDLFSRDVDRIHQSVKALFDCPQNNLKVFCGKSMLYGNGYQDCGGNDVQDYRRALSLVSHSGPSLQCCDEIFNTLESELIQIVSTILFTDPFLKYLLEKQRYYDILDADGAILVYNRLVSLCSSNEEAEMLLDADLNQRNQHSMSTVFIKFVHYLNTKDRPSNQTHQSWYTIGKTFVKKLEKVECVELLQNWLLSLVLCDISFFIILNTNNRNEGCDAENSSYHCVTTTCGLKLHYKIKVVDYDRKPAKKLRKKELIEAKIALFYKEL